MILIAKSKQDYNASAIRILGLKHQVSPLKRVKRKVGYGGAGANRVNGGQGDTAESQLKKMRLDESDSSLADDVKMD